MAITIVRNVTGTDAGKPQLTDAAGALANGTNGVLDYCLVTTLGWTSAEVNSTANVYAYTPAAGNKRVLFALDSAATAANAACRLWGCSATGAANTQAGSTNPFPTNAQAASGLYMARAASATAIPWIFISNGTLFHLLTYYTGSTFGLMTFGDVPSYLAGGGDAFATMIAAPFASGAPAALGWINSSYMSAQWNAAASTPSSFLYGSYNQSTLTPAATIIGDVGLTVGNAPGVSTNQISNMIDVCNGNIWITPLWICETGAAVRAPIPGIWGIGWYGPPTSDDGAKFAPASGPLSGRTFELHYTGAGNGGILFETSNTWGGY